MLKFFPVLYSLLDKDGSHWSARKRKEYSITNDKLMSYPPRSLYIFILLHYMTQNSPFPFFSLQE